MTFATTAANVYPECREAFGAQYGDATITQCPNCSASILCDYQIEGVLFLGSQYKRSGCFSPEELQQFRSDLAELTKNSSKLQVALFRFKHVMSKVGTPIASGVRDIVIDILSEVAKKAI